MSVAIAGTLQGMDPRSELGAFLRSRRARLRPEDVGLPDFGRRRVPGLRREELAQLAGVSADYYVRLEQGRDIHPSEGVLDAIARALRLDDAERAHLHRLVKPGPRIRRGAPAQRVRPGVQHLLDAMERTPAFVVGRRMDVLAWNRMAAALMSDFAELPRERRNMLRHVFLDPASHELYPDWEVVAEETVAYLRLATGIDPDDADLAALVGELTLNSGVFAQLWTRHDVREKTHGSKRFAHPLVGPMTLEYETLTLPDPGQVLVTYTAEPGSRSAEALDLLGSLAYSEAASSTK
jgi:transcriptional regulator with XRE-family HTH domain